MPTAAATTAASRATRRAPKRRRGDNSRGAGDEGGGAVTRTGQQLVRFAQRVQRVLAVVTEPEIIMQVREPSLSGALLLSCFGRESQFSCCAFTGVCPSRATTEYGGIVHYTTLQVKGDKSCRWTR